MISELCANPKCRHDKDSHYGEFSSSGDITKPAGREKVYYNCLCMHCTCKKFVPEKKR